LEACVLALVARDGPITAYQVRMEFEGSLASSWRASTGSVYPLIKRLATQGLVRMKAEPGDGRGTKQIVATAEGKRRVEAWLTDAPRWVGDVAEDPIRTRVHFLALLTAAKRAAALRDMQAATREAMAEVDARMKTTDQRDVDWLILHGVRAMLAARGAWLKEVGRFF
jgi:DNA-binding PadR family transcriptional regulator